VRYEHRHPERVGPFDVVVAPGVVAVPELPDAVANLAAAGLVEQIISYDQPDTEEAP
jgi:hypothetical protein